MAPKNRTTVGKKLSMNGVKPRTKSKFHMVNRTIIYHFCVGFTIYCGKNVDIMKARREERI